ncbi:membrane protein, partial [Carbonactinospora thermoautotrophica]
MWRVLLVYVVPLALTIYALIDCIQTDESEARGLPKPFWVLIILFGWLPGSIA